MMPSVEALESWIAEAAELGTPSVPLKVPVENRALFQAVYSICRQALRYSQAYVSTVRAGFEHEATPLSRAAFEHAVTAQWCYLTPGSHKHLVAGINASLHQYKVLYATMTEREQWLEELTATAPPSAHGRPSFAKMMEAVDHGKLLATLYAQLSQATHVTYKALTGYLDTSTAPFTLLEEREEAPVDRHRVAHTAAMASLLALTVLAHVADDHELIELCSDRSDQLHLPWFLR